MRINESKIENTLLHINPKTPSKVPFAENDDP